jgi:Cu(I)/Ag(I) efflux system periplasmic protein CusF
MKKHTTLALALVAALSAPAYALAQDAHHDHGAMMKTSSAAAALTDGEVKKVDKDAGKMTIKHGPIENLGMSNMTMVFRVKNPAMLDQVKPGDKIRFAAEKVNGALTVTKIEAAK